MARAGRIFVELILEDGKFVRRVAVADERMKGFRRTVSTVAPVMSRAERSTRGFGTALRDMTIIAGLARSALLNLNTVFTGPMRAVIKVNAEFERMNALLVGMSGEVGKVANAIAKSNFDFLIEKAQTAPFSLAALTDSFVKMKSVGIDPTAGSMRGLVDAVASFGGDDAILKRASIAIQQMAGKGVISMEELRQQLGEAVPSAIVLMARSMNLTMKELVDIISKGQVEAKSALSNLFSEFNKVFGDSSQRLMETFGGKLARLNSQWQLFLREIGNFGGTQSFMSTLKEQVDDLFFTLQEPVIKQFAQDVGAAFSAGVKLFREIVDKAIEFRDVLKVIGEGLLIFLGGRVALSVLRSIGGAFANLADRVRSIGPAMDEFNRRNQLVMAGVARGSSAMRLATIRAGRLKAAMIVLGRSFTAFLGPIGLVALAVFEIMNLFSSMGERAEEAFKKIKAGQEDLLTQLDITRLKETIAEIDKEIASIKRKATGVVSGETVLSSAEAKQIADLEKKRGEIIVGIRRATARRLTNDEKREVERQLSVLRKTTDDIRKQYADRQQIIADQRIAAEGDEKRITELNKASVEARKQFHVDFIRTLKEQIDAELFLIDTGAREAERISTKVLERLKQKLRQAREDQKNDPLGKSVLLASKDDDDPADNPTVDKFQAALNTLKKKTAEANAEMKGLDSTVAKVKQQFANGEFPTIYTKKDLDILVKAAGAWDMARASLKLHRKALADNEAGLQAISQELRKVINVGQELNEEFMNPDGGGRSAGLISLSNRLQKNLDKVSPEQRAIQQAKANAILRQFQANEVKEAVIAQREITRNMKRELMTRKEAIQDEHNDFVEKLRQRVDLSKLAGEERLQAEKELNEAIKTANEKLVRDLETPMQKMLRNWKNTTDAMEQAQANWLDSLTDGIVDAVVDGKASFGDLARSIIKDILRIQLRAQIAGIFGPKDGESGSRGGGILQDIFGFVLKGLGRGPNPGAPTSGFNDAGQLVDILHTGGIVGKEGTKRLMTAFARNAPKFHGGGVVGLGRNEIPAVLKRGEGVFTPEQMRALGAGAAPNVNVNVINQSGKDVQATQRGQRFDGKNMILDVVLTAANSPGVFRDNLRDAVR